MRIVKLRQIKAATKYWSSTRQFASWRWRRKDEWCFEQIEKEEGSTRLASRQAGLEEGRYGRLDSFTLHLDWMSHRGNRQRSLFRIKRDFIYSRTKKVVIIFHSNLWPLKSICADINRWAGGRYSDSDRDDYQADPPKARRRGNLEQSRAQPLLGKSFISWCCFICFRW